MVLHMAKSGTRLNLPCPELFLCLQFLRRRSDQLVVSLLKLLSHVREDCHDVRHTRVLVGTWPSRVPIVHSLAVAGHWRVGATGEESTPSEADSQKSST